MSENCRPAKERSPSKPTKKKKTENSPQVVRATHLKQGQVAEDPSGGAQLLQLGESPVSDTPAPTFKLVSYDDLIRYHLERIEYDEEGDRRPPGVLRNHKSIINSWARHQAKKRGVTLIAKGDAGRLLIGDEISSSFIPSLSDYQKDQEEQGRTKGTIADRTSILWSVRESAIKLIKTSGLPASFAECLTYLVEVSGKPIQRIATAAGTSPKALGDWMNGVREPAWATKPVIEKLEEVLNVQTGTLTGRVATFQVVFIAGRIPTGSTPWREHQKEIRKFRYYLSDKEAPARLKSEFNDLRLFHTDDVWLTRQRLKRSAEWRIRPNGKCPSADKSWETIRAYLGFVHLPSDADNPWLRGLGVPIEMHSLALFSVAEYVISHLEFKRCRAYSQAFNTQSLYIITFSTSLLRKKTGFLRQQPQYGSRLPNPVPPDEWDEWCETNREQLLDFRSLIEQSKNRPVSKTRDPFDGVRNIILEREHPLDALLEMTSNMKRLIPLKAKGAQTRYATFMRDLTYGEFGASYPMRVENFTGLTWIPKDPASLLERYERFQMTKDPADLLELGKKFIETEEGSNLYQKEDGSFWIRYARNEVKNEVPIDVPVAKSVSGTLLSYLLQHRPLLNRQLKDAINKRRGIEQLPLLTFGEERAIDHCPFVFRPCQSHVSRMSLKKFVNYKGTEQMSNHLLSQALYNMSRRYISNCKGFRAHAVRHLVASEYIKNYPNGYAEAAAALNITAKIVKKHYAWIPPCTKLKPWHDHFEALRERFEDSQAAA